MGHQNDIQLLSHHGERLEIYLYECDSSSNPLTAMLSHLTFHPFRVVSRYRDSQFKVAENS